MKFLYVYLYTTNFDADGAFSNKQVVLYRRQVVTYIDSCIHTICMLHINLIFVLFLSGSSILTLGTFRNTDFLCQINYCLVSWFNLTNNILI